MLLLLYGSLSPHVWEVRGPPHLARIYTQTRARAHQLLQCQLRLRHLRRVHMLLDPPLRRLRLRLGCLVGEAQQHHAMDETETMVACCDTVLHVQYCVVGVAWV